MRKNSMLKSENKTNTGLSRWLTFTGKRDLGILAFRGLGSAFIFDAFQSLLWKTWTGIQPTPLVQRIRQLGSYCSNLKLFLVNAGCFSLLHPRLEQYLLGIPENHPSQPFCLSDMRYFLFRKLFRHFPGKLISI